MKKKAFIVISIPLAIIVFIYLGFQLFIASAFGAFDKDYSTDELVENFNKKQTEIYDLKSYFKSVIPINKQVEIEFESDKKLGRLRISEVDSLGSAIYQSAFEDWDLMIGTDRSDSIISSIGWNRKTLEIIKDKLDRANCISVSNERPAHIGFKRSGMGMYSFDVFDNPIPDSLKNNFNDSCRFIYVNPTLVLQYGGGAAGPQCFYKISKN